MNNTKGHHGKSRECLLFCDKCNHVRDLREFRQHSAPIPSNVLTPKSIQKSVSSSLAWTLNEYRTTADWETARRKARTMVAGSPMFKTHRAQFRPLNAFQATNTDNTNAGRLPTQDRMAVSIKTECSFARPPANIPTKKTAPNSVSAVNSPTPVLIPDGRGISMTLFSSFSNRPLQTGH